MHKKNSRSESKRSVEEYVFDAENSRTPPPPPATGIPKQWLFCWIRWPIRILFLPFIWLDIAAQKIARLFIRTPYKKVGKCQKRGNCCYYILMSEPKGFLGRLHFFWNTQINGFFLRDLVDVEGEKEKIAVMGCRYLKADGSCRHHRLRPAVCREWPRIEYFEKPKILKGCGYKAVPRNPNSKLPVLPPEK